jgi:uncharacterized protein YbbK (DUF523 family)
MQAAGIAMQKLLVSACLLGDPVHYDGRSKKLCNEDLERLLAQGRVVRFCPEVAGGLPIPRPAAEIQRGDGAAVISGTARVQTRSGEDVSGSFITGAQRTLEFCRRHRVAVAVLSEASPSCGSTHIYDGSFTGRKIEGGGVTTALLRQNGIEVYSQHQLADALDFLDRF